MQNSKHRIGDFQSILFIVENNTVPPDIRVWREARTARQAGYSVAIISPKSEEFSKGFEVIDNIEIYRHPMPKNTDNTFSRIFEYLNAFFWESLLCLRVFIKNRFDIIHGANPPDHMFLIAFPFKMFGVKFVFDHHDLSPDLYLFKFNNKRNIVYKIVNLMEKYSCLRADAIISTNESYKKHIINKYRINPKKISIVRNDPEVPNNIQNYNKLKYKIKSPIKLLYVGRINIQDGVDLLIKVLHILANSIGWTNFHCYVVGDGEDLPNVKKLCTEFSLNSYVDFTGYIYERKKVQQYINNADICLETASNTEFNNKSTFIKIMEYMAAGKPIVAFDLVETRFSAKESALLIRPGDLQGFAQGIMKLAEQPELMEKMGRFGVERIKYKLNWEISSKELIDIYKRIKS